MTPSAAANRCNPRTAISARAADTADSGAAPVSGSPRRSATRNSLTSVSVTLARSSIPRRVRCSAYRRRSRRYELSVLAADAALDRQVVEIALQLVSRAGRKVVMSAPASLEAASRTRVGLSIHGASTGRGCAVPGPHCVGGQNARDRHAS